MTRLYLFYKNTPQLKGIAQIDMAELVYPKVSGRGWSLMNDTNGCVS